MTGGVKIPKRARVLVTGATGFIGSRLVEVLVKECDANVGVLVRNLTNAPRIARFPVNFHLGEVGDYDSLLKATKWCDIVFNLAYDFGVKNDEKRAVSIANAENVARAVMENKVDRLVHFSTISAYGDLKDGPFSEATPPADTEDLYGLSKRDADDVFLRWFEEKELPVSIIQPTIVYGPYSKPWTHGPLGQLTSGLLVLPNGGTGLCNAVYVDDVVQGAILAASKECALGKKFLISGAESVTWKAFFGVYENMLGYKATLGLSEDAVVRLAKNPKNVRSILAGDGEQQGKGFIRQLFLSAEVAGGPSVTYIAEEVEQGDLKLHLPNAARLFLLKSKSAANIDKARSLLGYAPQYNLAEGMALTHRYAEWANLLKPAEGPLKRLSERRSATPGGDRAKAPESGEAAPGAKAPAGAKEAPVTIGQRGTNDRERLLALKDSCRGRRCFVIGNGPSLRETDITCLMNEITIGCNGLFLLFDEMGFVPTFYTVEDNLVAEDRAEVLNALRGTTKVWPEDLEYCLKRDDDTVYINFIRPSYKGFPKFSDSFEDHVYWGGTVTYLNLQLAYFLGCTEIYLVGVDHSYRAKNPEDEQEGFTITARTPDPNHFHPDYFGPGFRYHDPKVDRMEAAYRAARDFLTPRGVTVRNATKGGMLDVFPRVDYDPLFEASAPGGAKAEA